MDIESCYNTLELPLHASLREVRQAYKDLVNVWHPDRFVHNPRLRDKAEKKLREINAAYQILLSQLSISGATKPGDHRCDFAAQAAECGGKTSRTGKQTRQTSVNAPPRDKTEVAVELGTRVILTVCHRIYKTLRHAAADLAAKAEREAAAEELRSRSKNSSPPR